MNEDYARSPCHQRSNTNMDNLPTPLTPGAARSKVIAMIWFEKL